MAQPPDGMDIVMVKPGNYAEIMVKSSDTYQPYTEAELEAMYYKGLANNSAVCIVFTTQEVLRDLSNNR